MHGADRVKGIKLVPSDVRDDVRKRVSRRTGLARGQHQSSPPLNVMTVITIKMWWPDPRGREINRAQFHPVTRGLGGN